MGFLGKEHHVMVVHMHNDLANNVFGPKKLDADWDWISQKIQQSKVHVVMGDFNMSLFKGHTRTPQSRSRD